MPIDPTQALAGARDLAGAGSEWKIDGVEPLGGADQPGAGQASFGDMLGSSLESLTGLQDDAAGQSRALAEGTATDVSEVVMAVERARLSMQLASQIRGKGVEAFQDVFHTAV
jgi:flagellar hook-basal body complex protein FliE